MLHLQFHFANAQYNNSVLVNINMKLTISKTCLYNFDLLKPHFYIVKLGFTRVYIFFFFFLLKKT